MVLQFWDCCCLCPLTGSQPLNRRLLYLAEVRAPKEYFPLLRIDHIFMPLDP